MFRKIPSKLLIAIIFISIVMPIDPLLIAFICIYFNISADVINHLRSRKKRKREKALDELTEQAQDLDMGY